MMSATLHSKQGHCRALFFTADFISLLVTPISGTAIRWLLR